MPLSCQNCHGPFEPRKFNQRFCSPKCKADYWNSRMLDNRHNLRLTPSIHAELTAYAEAHRVPFDIMGNEMLGKMMNPEGRPLEDIEK